MAEKKRLLDSLERVETQLSRSGYGKNSYWKSFRRSSTTTPRLKYGCGGYRNNFGDVDSDSESESEDEDDLPRRRRFGMPARYRENIGSRERYTGMTNRAYTRHVDSDTGFPQGGAGPIKTAYAFDMFPRRRY